MKNYSKKHDGFTLIEMIISIALFAILMTPVYSIIISTMNKNKDGGIKQIASLHGQEIFEEIKSGSIVTDTNGNITSIGDIAISSLTGTGTKTFDENHDNNYDDGDYEANVTIKKNTSITLDKNLVEENTDTGMKPYEFSISLTGSSDTDLKVNDNTLNDVDSNTLNLVITTSESDNKKVLTIKDGNNNEVLTSTLSIDEKMDKQIKLTINFSQYKLKNSSNDGNYKKVKIVVYNQDSIPLNVCLEKSTDLNVTVDNKLGEVKVYDNRAEDGEVSNSGELYDINVEITQKQGNETKTIFTGKTSQNISVD